MISHVTKAAPRYQSIVTLQESLSNRMELCSDIQRNILMVEVLTDWF